ncbi:MAG: flagellin [SAR324 cluster bacterium]|mgnify:FL=1|nr:flagellin [SAR324 cluster bacterium]|tara:strand:+ start:2464 stop:4080 length:1617 start_codon:yes stop_codon:yes gene_type:complete
MAMRIRQNPTSLNALRHSGNHFDQVRNSIEKLSSGVKINKGADGPASLIASERLRGRIVGIQQAYNNATQSVSLMQTAEGSLNEVSGILIRLRQLSTHAQNEAVNDPQMLAADQMEIEQLLRTVDRISQNTQFGSHTLLDGSMGANGVTVGDHLRFVSANPQTPPSPESGWEVDIHQVATRASKEGAVPITVDNIADGAFMVISEGGKNATIDTREGQMSKDIQQIVENTRKDPSRFPPEEMAASIRSIVVFNIKNAITESGLDVHVLETPNKTLLVRHNQFGDEFSFSVTSSVPGILSDEANVAQLSNTGKNVEGMINKEVALGKGQMLTALEGTSAAGVTVEYGRSIGLKEIPVYDDVGARIGTEFIQETNEEVVGGSDSGKIEGYVHISQQSKEFQVGPDSGINPSFSFINVRTKNLGHGVVNDSNFKSLSDIDVRSLQGARDAAKLVDKVIEEISVARGELGAFQKNAVESNLNSLKIAEENITQAESVIRDSDMAEEMSKLTGDQIMLQASTAMVSQANQVPRTVLDLVQSNG